MHISKLAIAVLALLAASSTANTGGAVKGFPNEYESHQYKGYGECPNGEVCELTFDDVPSGAVLMATNINCFFYTEDNPAAPFANLNLYEGASIQQSNERSNFIAPLVSANSYVVNES